MLSAIIEKENIETVEKLFSASEKIVIVTHVSPDGDALGSSLGLYHYLVGRGKKVQIIVPNAYPDFLNWLPGAKAIYRYDKKETEAKEAISEADLICCLDFNTLSRINELAEPVRGATCKKIMIDHHLDPEPFCDVTISHPPISSTSELVFRLIYRLGGYEELSFQAAECIYTGMMTDTGGFTYSSNQPEIYTVISALLAKGIDKDAIYRRVFYTYSENRLRLMGYVLYEKMQVYPSFRSALICLSREEQKKFTFSKGDTEGFVNLPLQMKGIKFSVFFREDTEQNMIKISLRSVGTFPCNKVASEFFGGGGHLNASGGEFYGKMEDAVLLFKQALIKYESLLQIEEN